MKQPGKIFILLICLLGWKQLSAQRVESALKELSAQFPQEKIYIHYDKDYYIAGQTIWFKSYLYSNWKPSGLSNNFYIQFINDKGELISSKEYPVIGAVVKGSIDIPDSLTQGNYYIRAYTPVIMNYDENFIYKKRIPVFSSRANPTIQTTASPSISLQFFPESGELVDNMILTLAFKAVNEKGLPVAVNGLIKITDGTNIAPFKTYHDGIGKMQFKPRAGKQYIAEIETASGVRTYPLPEVKPTGINIKITDEKGGKQFLIARTVKDINQYGKITVVADLNNMVVYKADIAMEDYPSVIGHIVTDSLPSGILHFTIFDNNGLPVAERLTFVDNREYRGKGEIATVKVNMEKRAANELELNFPDNTLRSCSVSVTDIGASNETDVDNIYSKLLLTSDLKGYIYNPAWYFKEGNDSAATALDNLMLTHGWSKFNWQKVLAKDFPEKKFKDPSMLTVSGQVFDAKTNSPVNTGDLNILAQLGPGRPQSYTVPVDASGHFSIDSLAFYGETKMYFDYMDKQGKDKPITIQLAADDDKTAIIKKAGSIPLVISEVEKYDYFQPANLVIEKKYITTNQPDTATVLENVSVKTKASKPEQEKRPLEMLNEKYTTGFFAQQPRTYIDNVNVPPADKSQDALRFIANRISQVQLVDGTFYSKHKTTLEMTDWSKNVTKSNNPLTEGKEIGALTPVPPPVTKASQNVAAGYVVSVYLNEIQVEASQLKGLSAKDIAFVKYFENFAGAGIGAIGGAIAVYTVNENYAVKAPADYPEYALKLMGYSITKEFYNPDYGNPEMKQPETDYRTTLYWNPSLLTSEETKSIKLNYYNNDFSKKLKVVVEGFDAGGKLIHLEKIIGN